LKFNELGAKGKRKTGMRIVGLALLVFCCNLFNSAMAGEIKVSGTQNECYGYFGIFKDIIKDDMKVTLTISPSSSARGLMDLDRGKIDIVTTDEEFQNLIADLERNGYPVGLDDFQVQGLGTKTILVFINKANKIPDLSQSQLSDIFVGKITNWKEVGGMDGEITVVWGDDPSEQNRQFQKFVIGDKPIVKTAFWSANEKDTIEKIVTTPGAIGIASFVYQSARTRNPRAPFVSSKAIAITKGAPSSEMQQVLELIKSFD
jgi:phosphate transport system substrate-binding protein